MAAIRSLTTGGAGLIGCHLVEELLSKEQQVHVIDNLSTGGIDNIEHLKGRKGFDYEIDSVRKRAHTCGHGRSLGLVWGKQSPA